MHCCATGWRLPFSGAIQKLKGSSLQPLNDLRTVKDFLGSVPVIAAMESPVSLVFLALVFGINPWLGCCAVVGALLQVFIAWLNERGTQPPLQAANRAAIAAQQYADSSLRNAQVIESMGMLPAIFRRWIGSQRQYLRLQAQASERAGAYQAWTKWLQTTLGSLLLGLGAWLALQNKLEAAAG